MALVSFRASALRCVLVTKGYTHRENHPWKGVVIILKDYHVSLQNKKLFQKTIDKL